MFRIATKAALLTFAVKALNLQSTLNDMDEMVTMEEIDELVFEAEMALGDKPLGAIELVNQMAKSDHQGAIWERLPTDMDKLVFTEKIAENLISYLDDPDMFNHKSCFNTCVQDDDIWFNDNKKRMLSFCEWTCYSILDYLENADVEDDEEDLIPVEPEEQADNADEAQADSQTCDMNCVGGQCNFNCEDGQCQLCENGQCVLCGDCQDCGPGYICVDGVCMLIDEQAPEDDKPIVAEEKPSEDVKPAEDETPA